jgi:predicted phage terminase large subunit-like protein
VKQRFIEGARLVQVQHADGTLVGVDVDGPRLLAPAPLNPAGIYLRDDRAFVPSLIADNPSLDAEEYRQSLMFLLPLERERLMHGDWAVREKGIFLAEWLRYYVLSGEQYELHTKAGGLLAAIPQRECRRFAAVDPAGTSKDIADEARSGSRSYTVVQVWDQPLRPEWSRHLILLHQARQHVSISGLYKLIRNIHADWKPERIWIEDEKLGHAVVTEFRKQSEVQSVPIDLVPTQCRDKPVRAATLANKMEAGHIFLPKNDDAWRPGFEAELLAWTGDKREPSDQIDAAAYAAIVSEQNAGGVLRLLSVVQR